MNTTGRAFSPYRDQLRLPSSPDRIPVPVGAFFVRLDTGEDSG